MSKNDMVVITCCHGKPKCMPLLEKWMKVQSFKNFDWLIVTDNDDGYKFTRKQKVIRRDNSNDTYHSLCHNVLEALEHVEGYSKIVFCEEDDYYARDYLYYMDDMLDKADLAGFANDCYYNVDLRLIKRWGNSTLASLAATGMTQKVVEFLKECCQSEDPFIDYRLWRTPTHQVEYAVPVSTVDNAVGMSRCVWRNEPQPHFKGKKLLIDNYTGVEMGKMVKIDEFGDVEGGEQPRHIGMKGNWWHGGVPGISQLAHGEPNGGKDHDGRRLKTLMPKEDAETYLAFSKIHKFGSPETSGAFLPDPNWNPKDPRNDVARIG